jgi:large subunit ribosomal protein L23
VSNERLLSVLIAPRVSEKTARIQADHNQYVFEVATVATKQDVKAAVEALFKVKVEDVQVMNVKGKTKGFRGRSGKRADWRKAYVTLADGQSIEFGAQG